MSCGVGRLLIKVIQVAMSEALERAKAGQELYEQRCYLWRLTCRLPLRDLKRLNDLLAKLSDDELRQVASYAEGLAEWPSSEVTPSGGAQVHEEPGGSPVEESGEEKAQAAGARSG